MKTTMTRWTALLAAALFLAPLGFAKKGGNGGGGGGNGGGGSGGGGGAPVPDGVIYFTYDYDSLWGMNSDGTGKTPVIDGTTWPVGWEIGDPSSLVYGPDPIEDRWFLVRRVPDNPQLYDAVINAEGEITSTDLALPELFAAKPDASAPGGILWVQLTDTFGEVFVATYNDMRWSNDGADSFLSFEGKDLSGALSYEDLDGDGEDEILIDSSVVNVANNVVYRLNLTGLEIDLAGPTLTPLQLADFDALDMGSRISSHDWSPNGQQLVVWRWSSEQDPRTPVDIVDFATGAADQIIDDGAYPRWSTDGLSIALRAKNQSPWAIVDIDVQDPSQQTVVAEYTSKARYGFPVWGPANSAAAGVSTHLVFLEETTSRRQQRNLVQFALEGGDSVKLTTDLEAGVSKIPLSWVGKDPAW